MNLHLAPTPRSQTREELDRAFRADYERHTVATRWDRRAQQLTWAALWTLAAALAAVLLGGGL